METGKGPEEGSSAGRSQECSGPSGPNSVHIRFVPKQTIPTPEEAYRVHQCSKRINVNVPPMSATGERMSP